MLEKKVRTEASKLQDRKAALIAKLGDATRCIGIRHDLIIESTADPLDYLQVMNQRDITIETLNRNSAVARDVKIALHNIESSEYGLCLECGNQIPDRRLDAIPWAQHCVPCQEALEQSRDRDQSDWATAA
jgi:DnaK suppressor protein